MDLMWKIREFKSFSCIWHLRKAIFHPTLLYSVQYTQLFWSFFSKHLAIRYIIRQFKIFYRIIVLSIAPWECFFDFHYLLVHTTMNKKIWKYLSKLFYSALWFCYDFLQNKFENTYQYFFSQLFDFGMIFYR